MTLTSLIEQGTANPLLLFGFALLIGALHGLEPGHSKTMMAAYIIAIRGTVSQAVLLGVSAAISHSLIVWVLAGLALSWGNELIGEELEPYFMIASGLIVLAIALWMGWQLRRPEPDHHHDHDHAHAHHHHHDHDQHDHHDHHHHHDHDHHNHDQPALTEGLDEAHMDAHARAHAAEIRARLSTGQTSTWQTILFGLSGGLIPCPAAITVFIVCLHLGQFWLGVTLVGAFSVGLALTMVAIGIIAALGLRYLNSKSSGLSRVLDAAPWISAVLVAVVGLVILWVGINGLGHGHAH